MTGDTMTILRSHNGRLAKLVRDDGTVEGYDRARLFDIATETIDGIEGLERVLGKLLRRPDCAVVRGAIADPARTHGVRRFVHADPKAGDMPTLVEVPRWWLALDVDGLPPPSRIDPRDLPACGNFARAALPPAFRSVRAILTASASHAIKPGARLRLWFWCSRPCCGPELRRWLRDAPVDHSVFRPAQLIYTAAPVFADGVQDHLPTRMAMLHGDESALPVPSKTALAPPPPRSVKLPAAGSAGGSRYALAALIKATSRVAQAAVNSRHCTMVAEARGLSRLIGAGLLTVAEVKHALGQAAETAGKTADEAEAVLEWALAHPSSARPSDGAGR